MTTLFLIAATITVFVHIVLASGKILYLLQCRFWSHRSAYYWRRSRHWFFDAVFDISFNLVNIMLISAMIGLVQFFN